MLIFFLGFGLPLLVSVDAATFSYDSGPLTVTQNFNADIINLYEPADLTFTGRIRNATVINSFGGVALFTNTIHSGAIFNIQGGSISVTGMIQNNVVFNQTAGSLNIDSVQNNAIFNIAGGSTTLNEPVGNNAAVSISGGTVILNSDDIFSNNANLTMGGGTLDTQGYNVSFDSLTLTGNATLDLGSNPDVLVDVGAISGSGTLQVINFVDTNQVTFNPGTSSINVGEQIFFGDYTAIVVGDKIMIGPHIIPEPGTWLAAALLLTFVGYRERRRILRAIRIS